MKFLKESFLKFNTYTQIQIGVIGVAFCIFFISVCLLSIISLILINTTYTEIQAMLEMKENDQINGVSIYVDSQINIASELSKIYEFNTRAFINNNLKNKDFINNFKGEKYKNYITAYNDNTDKNVYYERCFVDNKISEYEETKKILSAYLEVIDYTQKIKFYKNNDESMFKLFSYYSNESKCILYFPKIEFKENYSLINFETFIGAQVRSINVELDNYIDNYNLNINKENLAVNLGFNPLTSGYATIKSTPLTEFYQDDNVGALNSITLSIKFQENLTNSNKISNPNNNFNKVNNPFVSKDIKDHLVFEFSNTMIDKLLIKNLIKFPAFKTLVFNSQLLGKTSCGIMQNIYKFFNNTINKDNQLKLNSDKDCFLFPKNESLTYFDDYFHPEKTSKNYLNVDKEVQENLRRFVKIPVAYDSNYPEILEKAINFKILRFRAADVMTRILINSFFTVWLRPSVFILKNYSLITNNFRIIYKRFLSTQLKIISVNIIISILTGAIVVLLTYRVSKSIGDPISQLISIVKNINPKKEKKKNKRKKSIRNSILVDNKENKGCNNEKDLDNYDAEKDEYENENNAEENYDENNQDENNKENKENENENTQMKSEATVNNNEIVSKEKNLNNIKFPDDETINQFFNICKKLIKGGLVDENLKVKQMQYHDEAYNNISFMKSNNLIVQEEKILKETVSRSDKIFSHKSLIQKIKDFYSEKNYSNAKNNANNDNNNNVNQDLLSSQASIIDNFNNTNLNNYNFNNSTSFSKVYNPNKNANIIVNNKNGDEIKELKLERQRTIDKPIKNILGSTKNVNSFIGDSSQKPNIFVGSEHARIKYETVDLLPKFKDVKEEVGSYFQNTKNVNMTNLSYDNIEYILHANIERKKTDYAENSLFSEESEFDKIVGKHFTKETLDRVFEFLKLYSN